MLRHDLDQKAPKFGDHGQAHQGKVQTSDDRTNISDGDNGIRGGIPGDNSISSHLFVSIRIDATEY